MKPLSVKQFANECGCTSDAIRRKIGSEIIPITTNPVTIDADHYDFIIKTFQNKRRNAVV